MSYESVARFPRSVMSTLLYASLSNPPPKKKEERVFHLATLVSPRFGEPKTVVYINWST